MNNGVFTTTATALNSQRELLFTAMGPQPMCLLLALDSSGTPTVMACLLTPLSWYPYTMAVTIPNDRQKMQAAASQLGSQIVMALPTRDQLHQISVLDVELPMGISEVNAAGFTLGASETGVPLINECPVNFECRVYDVLEYPESIVIFLEVLAGTIDDTLLYKTREEIIARYPLNAVDVIVDNACEVRRVSLLAELTLCPTFPTGPKGGWYSTFEAWMGELCEESYITQEQKHQLLALKAEWDAAFSKPHAARRSEIKESLTAAIICITEHRWHDLARHLPDST